MNINKEPEKTQNHIYKQLWNRLTGQITATAQEIVSVAFRLSAMAKFELLSAQRQGAIIILVLMTTLVAIIIINSLILGQSLARPIIKLKQDIEKIGRGNLDHGVHLASTDEIGELAAAFNGMTRNLKKVTASKDTLEAEISNRKHVDHNEKERSFEVVAYPVRNQNGTIVQYVYVRRDITEKLKVLDQGVHFIAKPFSIRSLSTKVCTVLDH